MKKRKFIYALLAGLAFTACSNEDQAVQQPQKQSRPLTIEVTENPLIQDGEEGSNSNRAAITTTTSLSEFNLNFVYESGIPGSTSAQRDEVSGKWKENGLAGWPGGAVDSDADVAWYAWSASNNDAFHPTSDESATLPAYIRFSVEEASAYQNDLLVAKTTKKWSECSGKLSFTFDHACSAIRLYVKKATNINTHTLSISNIVLCNVVKEGKYNYSTNDWELTGTDANYTLFSGSNVILGSSDYQLLNGGEDDSYLFLIPQTLTAWNPTRALSDTYLELTCSIDGGASQTAYIPFGTSFQKGKKYDVKINIGKNSLYSGPNTLLIP